MRISDWSSDVCSSDLRALARGRVPGALHRGRCLVDEILQHVVEEAHDVLDEGRIVLPLEVLLEVQRRQAADGGALFAMMVLDGRPGDLAVEVRVRKSVV